MSSVVIYHAGCADGFCAAWLLYRRFPDATFIPASYGDAPPMDEIAGQYVYIVDFSYKRSVLLEMREVAKSLIVLDHHKTARDELEDLPFAVFDMEKSGARLTYEYIHRFLDGLPDPIPEPHWLVSYTEDRDLWKWQLRHSHEINAWLRSWPLEFDVWDSFLAIRRLSEEFASFVLQGKAILRSQEQIVDSKVDQSHLVEVARPYAVAGDEWASSWRVANATTLISETAGNLAIETGVGCCWFEKPDGSRVYSLRSRGIVDVSVMAAYFGGGGHASAAGFVLPSGVPHPWAISRVSSLKGSLSPIGED